jgi:hypothetical protein
MAMMMKMPVEGRGNADAAIIIRSNVRYRGNKSEQMDARPMTTVSPGLVKSIQRFG